MQNSEKPRHLGAEYAEQFGDASVAAAYANRPPYPEPVFKLLASLVRGAPAVLELGAGTGDITFGLAGHVEHIDAIEPSAAMRAAATKRAQPANVRWLADTAESFTPTCSYGLAVAAESLHWMDWHHVMPSLASWLSQDAVLAIVTTRALRDLPWNSELRELIARYSTNRDYVAYDIIEELSTRSLFSELGRQTLEAPFAQTVDQYVESFHSRNGFSRARMPPTAADAFDNALRTLIAPSCPHGRVAARVQTTVVWGRPRSVT